MYVYNMYVYNMYIYSYWQTDTGTPVLYSYTLSSSTVLNLNEN